MALVPVAFAPRPAPGTTGRPVRVKSNMFELMWKKPVAYFHYDVVINPEPKGDVVRRNYEIMQHLTLPEREFDDAGHAYDGKRNLYTQKVLSFGDPVTINVLMSTKNPPPPPGHPGHWAVTLKLAGALDPRALGSYLGGGIAPSADAQQILNLLNVVARQTPMEHYTYNSRSFFMDAGSQELGMGLKLVQGYFQSIRPARQRLLVNVDITTGIVWQDQKLLDTVAAMYGSFSRGRGYVRDLQDLDQRAITWLNHMLKGVRVIPTHRKDARPRSILRFDSRGANKIILEGTGKSVEEYFIETYRRHLQYPRTCCVWLTPTAALPLELLVVERGQLFKRKPSPELMAKMLTFSKKKPDERFHAIENGINMLMYNTSYYMSKAGLSVNPNAVVVQARQLPAPRIEYGNGKKIDPKEGQWNLQGQRFLIAMPVDFWAIVWLTREFNDALHAKVQQNLIRAMRSCGMNVRNETPVVLRQGHDLDHFEQALDRLGDAKIPQIVVLVFDGETEIYTRIKTWSYVTRGCPTQCLRMDKVMREPSQYYYNVVAKMNIKLGGVNHRFDIRESWLENKEETIVFGADVGHPAPGPTDQPSISGLSASVDPNAGRYVATNRVQRGRQEIIEDLADMVFESLVKYEDYRANVEGIACVHPTRVLFYRDGVSEGQFEAVYNAEIPAVRAGFARFIRYLKEEIGPIRLRDSESGKGKWKMGPRPPSNPEPPRITFVVVGKRHHVRFNPEAFADKDRSGNARAGLVVDTEIVHPYIWDFYELGHAGLLGTSRPMHVSVLVNENGMTQNQLEAVTFGLCHNFGRATRSISVPAPVRIAHIVSGQGKIHLSGMRYGSDDFGGEEQTLDDYRHAFKPVHRRIANYAYFM